MRIVRLCLIMIFFPTMVQATELSVFAASSLVEVLTEITQDYRASHPGVGVMLHFAGSQSLATQIEQGAQADLFIAADVTVMERLKQNRLVTEPRLLLRNQLVLAVQPEVAPYIASIRDIGRPNLLLVIGNRQVPIGRYTHQMFTSIAADPAYSPDLLHKIEQNIVSKENSVKAIVAKLLLGEVDAGIVYQSDLTVGNASQLTAIPLPHQHNPQALYPMARTVDSQMQTNDFISFLLSTRAQKIFKQQGFLSGDGL